MEHYFLIKHLHMSAAALSITLFVVRAWWSVQESSRLNARWVKVLPHLIDTALLGLGVTLMVLLSVWPWQLPWLGAKLLALLAYIGIGTIAIKRGATPTVRARDCLQHLLHTLEQVDVPLIETIILAFSSTGAALRHCYVALL